MFAINKNTRRKIVRVVLRDSACTDQFYLKDGLIAPCSYDDPEPFAEEGEDDSDEWCEAKDIVLVETLPEGYDEDGEWVGE